MTELTPVRLAGPTRTVVAGLLLNHTRNVEMVLRMGWETTRDGQVLPVPLVAVRRAQ
ncbi:MULTISPECIES: hypothetical protein [unclassified Streptomyces]|uniref:hypothetical protein n=1 Tax=unclassified Streptomyces TaxID=2593676 RepID=UPI002E293A14|nr:hypothetical protein [Streptomyces sp. NBC_00285]